ncbi:MAG: type II toxin-antitoxin system Phd/YefM family antitoxin [Beijerinckiaceae bacterium]|jgi:prevent-host-death family protein|nr:type II toxin-antitoxin system Phd/YefM family antitoxin [Beijerinckiaceae bacterium]
MKTITAAKAKNNFGQFLDMAQREPVIVTKNDRPVGIFMSFQDFEDRIWAERADEAHRQGYIGVEESEALLQQMLKASD